MHRNLKKKRHTKKLNHEIHTSSHIFSERLIVTLVVTPDPLFRHIAQLTLGAVLTNLKNKLQKEN